MKEFEKIPYTDEANWLQLRKSGIGGSDMGAVLGVNKYRSAVDVWLDKTNDTMAQGEESEAAHFGKVLEEVVANEFELRTGLKVRRNNHILRNIQRPYLMATIDREIVGEAVGLECKTASAYLKDEWEGDNVPDSYYIQCQHYMAVTGFKAWWIACLVGGNKFVYKLIPRNEEVINVIKSEGAAFWQHVEAKTLPKVDGSDACAKALQGLHPESNGEEIPLPPAAAKMAERFQEIATQVKALEEEGKALKAEMCTMLGDNERGTCGDFIISWKTRKGARSLDRKALEKDLPDVAAKYMKTGATTRTFTIKEAKTDGNN